MGDDLEKFGVWPGTNKLCYTRRLARKSFRRAGTELGLAGNRHPRQARLPRTLPLGRADLPTASYTEMMEWALPTPARNRYHALVTEFAARTEMLPFLRGGIWRNFFSKYGESNLLHKKMLHVSQKVRKLYEHPQPGASLSRCARAGRARSLLRGQCNDPYWHGVFGGLYSPHLRTALWRSLIQAEAIADALANPTGHYSERRHAWISTRTATTKFISPPTATRRVLMSRGRRHDFRARLPPVQCRAGEFAGAPSGVLPREAQEFESRRSPWRAIHSRTNARERKGWIAGCNYDRWARHCFRLLLFGREKKHPDCGTAQLAEDPVLAGGNYRVAKVSPTQATLLSEASADWPAEKTFSFANSAAGFGILCDLMLRRTAAGSASVYVGIEAVLNFLAPTSHDRYFESGGERQPLRWSAVAPGSNLRVVDEWQGVSVTLTAPHAQEFWITPIETVSESEEGFERIYQGSQIVAVWPLEIASGTEWRGQLNFNVARLT